MADQRTLEERILTLEIAVELINRFFDPPKDDEPRLAKLMAKDVDCPPEEDEEMPSFIESVKRLHLASKVILKHMLRGTEPTLGEGGEFEKFMHGVMLLNGRPELE